MGVLKFGAIYFDQRTAISEQNLGGGFDDTRLAGTGWAKEQKISDRARGGVQAGTEHLIEIGKRLHGLFLPDNLVPQCVLEMAGRGTALSRVHPLQVAPLSC